MVTGHGAFKERLHRLGLAEDSRCSCPLGGPETPEHILYECTKYNSIRDRLRESVLIEEVVWPHSWSSGCTGTGTGNRNFPYNENPTRAVNTTSLKCCLPSTDAIDRQEKIHACV